MIYWELFIGFLKVGCLSFGGAYGSLAVIREVVRSYGWLTDQELTQMIAISESTPGPIMVNLATYIGSSRAGLVGALIATIAVVLPAFIIIWLVAAVLKRLLQSDFIQAALDGLQPCMTGMILATGLYMLLSELVVPQATLRAAPIDGGAMIIAGSLLAAIAGFGWLGKRRLSPIVLIALGAIAGMMFG